MEREYHSTWGEQKDEQVRLWARTMTRASALKALNEVASRGTYLYSVVYSKILK